MNRSCKIKSCDEFGKQLSHHLRKVWHSFKNETRGEKFIKQLAIDTPTIIMGSLISIRPSLYNLIKNDKKILPVIFWSNIIYIGPYYAPNKTPCPHCVINAIIRRFQTQENFILENIKEPRNTHYQKMLFMPNTLSNVSFLIINTIYSKKLTKDIFKKIITVNTINGKISNEYLLPEIGCPFCNKTIRTTRPQFNFEQIGSKDYSHVNKDTKAIKNNSFKNPLIYSFTSTRTKPLKALSYLKKICTGKYCGIIEDVMYDLQMPFASCSAFLALGNNKREPTLGRSSRFDNSCTIAILEALERLAGFQGGNNIFSRNATVKELTGPVLDPRLLCLHSKYQYQIEGFPFLEYSENLSLSWIKGFNLTTNTEIWVPKCMGFYGKFSKADGVSLAYETSNGCSIGTSIEEAILHGLLELIERDSFLMTWYKKLKLYDITEQILTCPKIRGIYRKSSLFTTAKIKLFDSTMEHGIPTIFAMASNDKIGEPTTAVAAGAGVTIDEAAISALYELTGHYLRLRYLLSQSQNKEKLFFMLQNSHIVRTMEDHGLVNSLPESASRFNFLTNGNIRSPTSIPLFDGSLYSCPKECLKGLVSQLQKAGFQVVAVEQSTEILRSLGLFAAKVLVPGFVPMTFGYQFSRLETERLRNADGTVLLLTDTFPHPFP